jgi:copper chaperone NosL
MWRTGQSLVGFLALAVMFACGLLVWGCGGADHTPAPPEILYGKDTCQQCIMIVSDARYAAGYTDEDGIPRAFDDIGCMAQFIRERGDIPYVLWVSDYNTGEWVQAASAWFVQSDEVASPMGSGVVAVASESSAREIAARLSGTVLHFGELTAGNATDGRR